MVEGKGRFAHGGDVYDASGNRIDAIDFSANLNPLGMPAEVVQRLSDAAASFDIYPDPQCRALRAALAAHHGIPPEYVLCTAGASDLIDRLCLTLLPENALVTAPCFSGYIQALERVGAHIVHHRLREEEGFNVTARILDELRATSLPSGAAFDVVVLCSPNNPTGLVLDSGLLRELLDAARETGTTVVLDECFLGFTDETSAVELCAENRHLVVVRAFTKMYALAGLRLGYGVCADVGLVHRLDEAGQPWAVSTPAQIAGQAALGVEGWHQRTREYVRAEREALRHGLESLGCTVVPGQANYLLFRCPIALCEPLRERGILIRCCDDYEGLDAAWYRVAVRTTDENAALLQAMKEVLDEG